MSALTVVETDLAYKTREKNTHKNTIVSHRVHHSPSSSRPSFCHPVPDRDEIPSTNPDSRRAPHPPKSPIHKRSPSPTSPGARWSISYLHLRPSSRALSPRARAEPRGASRDPFSHRACPPHPPSRAPSRAETRASRSVRGRSPATDRAFVVIARSRRPPRPRSSVARRVANKTHEKRTWTLVALKAATRPTKEEARSADIVVFECAGMTTHP